MPIELGKGWERIKRGIKKVENMLDGLPEDPPSPAEQMKIYTTIYIMCTQRAPHDHSEDLYRKYREALESYVTRKVLPSIRDKHGQLMVPELLRGWSNHKFMIKWLSVFFHYLDRYFVLKRSVPTLLEVGLTCFRDRVYGGVCATLRDVLIAIIEREREGKRVDGSMLKNGIDLFIEIGSGSYEQDFEAHMLEDTRSYYSRKGAKWVVEDSCPCPDYMLKAEELLARERERVSNYMHSSTEQKLVDVVRNELLMVYANQLLEKEQFGCRALLRDGKVDDLSRVFRLYHEIPRGLELVSGIFKEHVTCEVQRAQDSARNRHDSGAAKEQILERKMIYLHEQYMAYVQDCFANHTLFHKALEESFETKKVGGSSFAI